MSGKKSRQQLFSCVLDDPNPSGEMIESEEELVDKVLKEGLKLKNRCKYLTKQVTIVYSFIYSHLLIHLLAHLLTV